MLQSDSGLKVVGVMGVPDLEYDDMLVRDLEALQEGGVDALLVENHGDTAALCTRNRTRAIRLFSRSLESVRSRVRVPFGLALLPYDHADVFRLAEEFDSDFVWFDTFVDGVAPLYTQIPVQITPYPAEIARRRTRPVFTEVQPRNFYELLENRPIEESVREALEHGADSIAVVRDACNDELDRVRGVVGSGYPLGITGGLNSSNVSQYKGRAQYAVVYGFFRNGVQENPVDISRVKELMTAVR